MRNLLLAILVLAVAAACLSTRAGDRQGAQCVCPLEAVGCTKMGSLEEVLSK